MTVGLSLGADRWRLIRRAWTPAALFAAEAYGWAYVAPDTVWADTAGTTPGVVGQTIRRLDDQRGAPWIGATTGPTYRVTNGTSWLEFAQTDGRQMNITVPAITNGTLMLAYRDAGVLSGNVTLDAGTYSIGRWGEHGVVGVLLIDRDLSQAEREQVRQWFIAERGAGVFSAATDFNRFGREQRLDSVDLFDTSNGTEFLEFLGFNRLTSVPLFDTSGGTYFRSFLAVNRLTSIPLFDTSSGTDLSRFLQNNSQLANVPAGLFDNVKGNNFTEAFLNCALTQQSVDNVLVSVATAAAANNLNNGTLTGLDSGANSAPSTTGVAAKNELIARGWTVATK